MRNAGSVNSSILLENVKSLDDNFQQQPAVPQWSF